MPINCIAIFDIVKMEEVKSIIYYFI